MRDSRIEWNMSLKRNVLTRWRDQTCATINHASGNATSGKHIIRQCVLAPATRTRNITPTHFLNILECYWQNPDINSIQVFGKDIRSLLATSCQKIFFEPGHTFYHYGPIESSRSGYSNYRDVDLSVATNTGEAVATVAKDRGSRSNANLLVLTERVYEYTYLRDIISHMLVRLDGQRIKSDNIVLNLSSSRRRSTSTFSMRTRSRLKHSFLQSLEGWGRDKRQLQVEVSNLIYEFDKKGIICSDAIQGRRSYI